MTPLAEAVVLGRRDVGRREFVRVALGAGAALLVAPRVLLAGAALPPMTVYKSPSCGCCKNWVAAARAAGFTVKSIDLDDLSEVKRNAGVTRELESCHTALVGPYAVEGHVPLDLVKKMLGEKPKIAGLAAPGMPVGAPGMEQGNTKQPYAVMAFVRGGAATVYARR